MIDYEFGEWGIGFIFRRSSVFKRAACISAYPFTMALMIGILVRYTLFKKYANDPGDFKNSLSLFGSWSFVLTFLLVFRTQIAYGRYWDGITSLQNVRGVWFNACSNLISFTSVDPSRQYDVTSFQHLLIRLMSLLYCTALQEVAVMEDENFGIIGDEGIQVESLNHLAHSADRLEVVMQWIQRLIMDNHSNGVLPIAPPILSRVFQELSNGIVKVQDAMKISEYPFPFPFAQMLTVLLCGFTLSTPIVFAFVIEWPSVAAILAWAVNFSFWSINYIAAEIEMPFGDDPNDLPIRKLQDTYNRKLVALMHPLTQNAPVFAYDSRIHDCLIPQDYRLSIGRFSIGRSTISSSSGLSVRSELHDDYEPTQHIPSQVSRATSTTSMNRTGRRGYHWKELNAKHWEQKKGYDGKNKNFGGSPESKMGHRLSGTSNISKNVGSSSESGMSHRYSGVSSFSIPTSPRIAAAVHTACHHLRHQGPRTVMANVQSTIDSPKQHPVSSKRNFSPEHSPKYQMSSASSMRRPSKERSQHRVVIGEHEEITIGSETSGSDGTRSSNPRAADRATSVRPTDSLDLLVSDGPPGPVLTAGRCPSPFFYEDRGNGFDI